MVSHPQIDPTLGPNPKPKNLMGPRPNPNPNPHPSLKPKNPNGNPGGWPRGIDRLFRNNGYTVITAKYGKRLKAAFKAETLHTLWEPALR